MSTQLSIQSSLLKASVDVATINDSRSPDRFTIMESRLSALGQRITREDALEHLPEFSAIQERFLKLKDEATQMSSRSVSRGAPPKRSAAPRSSLASSPSSHYGSLRSTHSSMVPAIRTVRGGIPMPEATRVMGSISQFSDGASPVGTFSEAYRDTCPSTSLSFISRFLNHGNDGLDGNKLDQVIRIGQERFLRQIENKHKALAEVEVPMAYMDSVRGNQMAPVEAAVSFDETLGPRPHSPKSFILTEHSEVLEGKLSGALTRSLIPQALKQPGGKLIVPITANGMKFHILLVATKDTVKASLCSLEGEPVRGTESAALNNGRGIGAVSNHLVALMTTESRKQQLSTFINETLIPLANMDPNKRAASTITINGQTTAIGVDLSGAKPAITLFDSHGNVPLNESGHGFAYVTDNVDDSADILLRMLYVKSKKIEVRGMMSKEQMAFLRQDVRQMNEVSTWVVLPREELVPYAEGGASSAAPAFRGPIPRPEIKESKRQEPSPSPSRAVSRERGASASRALESPPSRSLASSAPRRDPVSLTSPSPRPAESRRPHQVRREETTGDSDSGSNCVIS